ncbi:MAG: phosphoglycolate phosphatase [Burkholderiales bacterium]
MTKTARVSARAVILDLDGTLLDTAADLAAATNLMMLELGREPLSQATVASYIGKGVEVLVHRALGGSLDARVDHDLHTRGHDAFMRHYQVENGRHSRPYAGVVEGVAAMRAKGLRLACVTNKPKSFADPLLERFGLAQSFELIVGGDTLPLRKPDPMPMLHVAQRFEIDPPEIVAIGDSLNDALAARAAGMPVFAVPYGYNEGRDVRTLDVDAVFDSLLIAADHIDLSD